VKVLQAIPDCQGTLVMQGRPVRKDRRVRQVCLAILVTLDRLVRLGVKVLLDQPALMRPYLQKLVWL
jgi:hypothetical protein